MLFITSLNEKTKKNLIKYRNTKFNYSNFINEYYIDNDGYAYISIKVNKLSDVISDYSIKDYEWINSDFAEYINNQAKYIPVGEAVLVEICGHEFSKDEQAKITKVLKQYFGLKYGDSILEKNVNKRKGLFLFIFSILSIIIYVLAHYLGITSEFILLGLWYFIWEFLDLALLEGSDLDNKSLKAAQLANIKIVFNANEK